MYSNYYAYLRDARQKIAACQLACSNWSRRYEDEEEEDYCDDEIGGADDTDNEDGNYDDEYYEDDNVSGSGGSAHNSPDKEKRLSRRISNDGMSSSN